MVKYVPLDWLVSIEPRYLKLTPDELRLKRCAMGLLKKCHG